MVVFGGHVIAGTRAKKNKTISYDAFASVNFPALALVPLLVFTSDSKLMGELVNSTLVKRTGWAIVVVVVALNLWLLVGTALGL